MCWFYVNADGLTVMLQVLDVASDVSSDVASDIAGIGESRRSTF